MAALTPVIGLTAMMKSVSGERRVLGRGCGMRELVEDVCNRTEVEWCDERNMASDADISSRALGSVDSETTNVIQVKGTIPSSAYRPHQLRLCLHYSCPKNSSTPRASSSPANPLTYRYYDTTTFASARATSPRNEFRER
jgi:hypothetical protein